MACLARSSIVSARGWIPFGQLNQAWCGVSLRLRPEHINLMPVSIVNWTLAVLRHYNIVEGVDVGGNENISPVPS